MVIRAFKKTIEGWLKVNARTLIDRRRPLVVGVTGSVGKTSTKEAIAAVLAARGSVWQSQKNYNNELGVPLTILGLETGGRSVSAWLKILFMAWWRAVCPPRNYPAGLVLEMGIDRPGDMDPLVFMARPRVGVVTTIGPSHLEFFGSIGEIAAEKGKLVRSLPRQGVAVLNYDDERVRDMSALTSGTVITYGFQQKANVRGLVTPEGLNLDADRWLQSPAGGRLGMSFKIAYRGNVVPVRLPGVGLPQAYAALAAAAVGISQKMNLVEIGSALRNFEPLPGRMRLIEGIKKTLIIDDTYNAAPASTISALQYLKNVRSSGRKIAVLGDMLELGIYTEEGHREVGQRAAATVDVLVAVGQRAKFIAAAAREAGMSAVTEFGSYEAVGAHLEELLQSYDTVLIKASQRVRLEKVVKEIMAHPEEADKLLVRQGKRWQEI